MEFAVKGVYLLHAPAHGWYKIGRANDIEKRYQGLASSVPFELQKIAVFECDNNAWTEQQLLAHFATKRIRGEWFRLDSQDVASWGTMARRFSKRISFRQQRSRLRGYTWSKEALQRKWEREASPAATL